MCHVLIIEDDVLAAMDIRAVLARSGATSFSFADTEREAVASARESRPEVIVSDVLLSSGFGPDAVRSIHAEHGVIPAIFITGTPEQCRGCDPEAVLEKPFSTDRLAALFRTMKPSGEGPRAN